MLFTSLSVEVDPSIESQLASRINFRIKCGANVVTQPSGIRVNKTFELHRVVILEQLCSNFRYQHMKEKELFPNELDLRAVAAQVRSLLEGRTTCVGDEGCPLSSEYGTHKTVEAIFWHLL